MINGTKTRLRAIENSDVELYHRWINDAESNATRSLYHPTSREDAKEFLDQRRTPSATQITLLIEKTDGMPVGLVGLRAICTRSHRAEIWIYIGERSEWRNGLGFDAMDALIKYGFHDMNLHRLWLQMDPTYTSIAAMYERLGFIREGTLRQDYFRHGEYRDVATYGLLRSEWLLKQLRD